MFIYVLAVLAGGLSLPPSFDSHRGNLLIGT